VYTHVLYVFVYKKKEVRKKKFIFFHVAYIKWRLWQDDPDLLERGEILCPCERRTKAKAGGYFCVMSSVCFSFWIFFKKNPRYLWCTLLTVFICMYVYVMYIFFIKWKSWQDDPDLLERGEILCPCERRTKAKAGGFFCVMSCACCFFFWIYNQNDLYACIRTIYTYSTMYNAQKE